MEDAPGGPTTEELVPRRRRNFVFGGMLIAAGILLLANHLTVFHVGALWPLFIIGIGIVKFADACCGRQRRTAIGMVGVGLWFALNEFTHLRYHDTWPLLLLLWGALLIWNGVSPDRWCPTCAEGRHAH
ncbi:MAG: LiaI-LiaF-like domain-containing protein [Bacteroidales bacterium]